ncbi:MAG: hypothetical protein IJ770_03470 [Alphaproteobacteria bacterium]|nr:hypothetical protein [Alphaproteobacteria bacterium]
MKYINLLLIGLCALFFAACTYIEQPGELTWWRKTRPYARCHQETTIAVYDNDGMFTLPGCVDYDIIEGEFPYVENNKYPDEVVYQNLNSRVLAYCRGTPAQIEYCVNRLEGSCYVPLSEIPKVPAKYDTLKRGTYPERRWHEGDTVPRW